MLRYVLRNAMRTTEDDICSAAIVFEICRVEDDQKSPTFLDRNRQRFAIARFPVAL
jgi:hypothetical protein